MLHLENTCGRLSKLPVLVATAQFRLERHADAAHEIEQLGQAPSLIRGSVAGTGSSMSGGR